MGEWRFRVIYGVGVIVLMVVLVAGPRLGPSPEIDSQAWYWLFAAAAQSLAALFAFILAGYAFVHQGMAEDERTDPTLRDVYDAFRRRLFGHLRTSSIATGAAILFSMAMLVVNQLSFPWKLPSFAITSVLIAIAVLHSVLLVLEMVRPDKRAVGAQAIVKKASAAPAVPTESHLFFDAWRLLEARLRQMWGAMAYAEKWAGATPPRSTRQIADDLNGEARINDGQRAAIHELAAVRNALFHGHIDSVDGSLLGQLYTLLEDLEGP